MVLDKNNTIDMAKFLLNQIFGKWNIKKFSFKKNLLKINLFCLIAKEFTKALLCNSSIEHSRNFDALKYTTKQHETNEHEGQSLHGEKLYMTHDSGKIKYGLKDNNTLCVWSK